MKIRIEKKHTVSTITVLVSTTKLDINPKISFVFCLKSGFPGTTIKIIRVLGNNFENSNRGKKANITGAHVSKSKIKIRPNNFLSYKASTVEIYVQNVYFDLNNI